MAEYETLLVEQRGAVTLIMLNRPQALNALNSTVLKELTAAMAAFEADDSQGCVVLTGAGDKAFAAGTDIAEFHAVRTAQDGLAYEAKIERVLGAFEALPIPTIAAIAGACTGGGAAIAACCDLRIGTASTRFGFPIARTLGNCLSAANYARIAALIGASRVKDLVFTARLMESDEALRLGLLNEVVPDHAALMKRAHELAATVAGHAPLTLRVTKEALRRIGAAQAMPDDDDLIGLAYGSEDFREGVASFLAKRPPQWKGR